MAKKRIDLFNELRVLAEGNEELTDFIDVEIDKIVSAAKKKAEKKAEANAKPDPLSDAIFEIISNAEDALTREEIVEAYTGDEEISAPKVTVRCTKMVKEGKIAKEAIILDGKRRTVYYVPDAE